MNQQIMTWSAEWLLAIFIVAALLITLLASAYDIRQIRQNKLLRSIKLRLRKPNQPFITVLVYANNSADSIGSCIKSIQKSYYWHYDIVVIDCASTDSTRAIVRSFIKIHPKLALRLYAKRGRNNKINALRRGYYKSKRGDLILSIDASNMIPRTLLKEAATRFVVYDNLGALSFNVFDPNLRSITKIYHRFQQLSVGTFIKARTLVSNHYVRILDSGVMYRRSVFNKAHSSPSVKGAYGDKLTVIDGSSNDNNIFKSYLFNSKPPRHFKDRIYLLVPLLAAASVLFVQSYSMYLSANSQNNILLLLGCFALAIWVLALAWSTESMKIHEKIQLSTCAVILYFLLYFRLIIYIFSLVFMAILSWKFPVDRPLAK